MNRLCKVSVLVLTMLALALGSRELYHIYRHGHLAPLGLHADVEVSTSNDLLGVEGAATIYRARLTNYGLLPATMLVCDYLDSGIHATMVNYVVERWDPKSDRWKFVPEWDEYGSRLFCRPSFEVTETHVTRRRLWPSQSIQFGEVVPAQAGGFHIGDRGRFTIFLAADGNRSNTLSTASFRVDQQMKNR